MLLESSLVDCLAERDFLVSGSYIRLCAITDRSPSSKTERARGLPAPTGQLEAGRVFQSVVGEEKNPPSCEEEEIVQPRC